MIQTGHARARAVAKRYDPTAHTRLALFPQVQRSPGCDSLAQAMGARVAGDEQAQHSLFLVARFIRCGIILYNFCKLRQNNFTFKCQQ